MKASGPPTRGRTALLSRGVRAAESAWKREKRAREREEEREENTRKREKKREKRKREEKGEVGGIILDRETRIDRIEIG